MVYSSIISQTESRYTSRYLNFLAYCKKVNLDYEGIVEKHHILPVSVFPEYKSFDDHPWNMIQLTPRQHFIAHWMLAKMYGGKLWFAFNMMKRTGHTSCLYEAGRKYLSEQIKKTNTGRLKTEQEALDISRRTKNTVVVKDQEGKLFRISRDDPRYLSGEFVFYRTGTKHKSETLLKMRKNSGIRGKKPFITESNDCIVYLSPEEGARRGLQEGLLEDTRKKLSKTFSQTIWVTLKKDGTHKRISTVDFSPNEHVRGRIGYKGWDHVNANRRKN